MPFAFIVLIVAALHYYIGARIVPQLNGIGWQIGLAALLATSAVVMPLGFMMRRAGSERLRNALSWAGMLAMGLFSSLFIFTALRDLMLLGAAIFLSATGSGLFSIDRLESFTAPMVPAIAIALTFFGFLNARRTAGVVTVEIPVAGLPLALQGFTIVQISDVHVGPTIRARYVERIVAAVNRLQPDLVAITGDLVDGSVAQLKQQVAPLARLASRNGSFFVTGNHEYYSGVVPWISELQRLGINVLHNEHVVIERGDAKLVLAGVTDFTGGHFDESHRSDPQASLARAPGDAAVKVLLAHQPRSAAAASRAGFDLQLSGHTHGGQFWPWNHFVRLQQPFTAGLNRLDELLVYVSRGTGYWGPPKRLFAPSEITQVRLVAASA
ncbi:metallophosphoesterase [Caenimonas koreensis]|uniref:Metallophosphoesterase n=1 Tax=Caenimonas koreensis DSM 17982 TaxID=1121255 RepID=A0A844B0N7_9BURK|nr:metallophosphoesterase [Caenimonas koreensis]MRD46683.1 metallophosphoesterase [Caenimonas koreensis DSM 17982]